MVLVVIYDCGCDSTQGCYEYCPRMLGIGKWKMDHDERDVVAESEEDRLREELNRVNADWADAENTITRMEVTEKRATELLKEGAEELKRLQQQVAEQAQAINSLRTQINAAQFVLRPT